MVAVAANFMVIRCLCGQLLGARYRSKQGLNEEVNFQLKVKAHSSCWASRDFVQVVSK